MNSSDKLESVISKYSGILACGALISESGEVLHRVGNFTDFEKGLASAVLGPYGSPKGTFTSTAQYENDRKMLPRGMGQGNLFALLDKPNTEFVIALFGYKSGDLLKDYNTSKEIGDTLLETFNS